MVQEFILPIREQPSMFDMWLADNRRGACTANA